MNKIYGDIVPAVIGTLEQVGIGGQSIFEADMTLEGKYIVPGLQIT